MAKPQTWLEQFNRYVIPLGVLGIAVYGTWDLLIQPLMNDRQSLNVCMTQMVEVAVFKPATKLNQSPKRIQAPDGLAIVVPAGEQRLFSATIDNTEELPVTYQWRATYGRFSNRTTVENKAMYTAPKSLVNDLVTVEATLRGCSATKRTLNFAIVPSAKVPLTNEPLTEPTDFPTPTPTFSSTLPTVQP